jgi:hypothetical protein
MGHRTLTLENLQGLIAIGVAQPNATKSANVIAVTTP